MKCDICNSQDLVKPRPDLEPHPYTQCKNCKIFFQPNMKPKVYEGFHESRGDLMSERDKSANFQLATLLYSNHIKKMIPNKTEYRHLDIGSKYPYLGHCLQKVGPITSFGMDGIDLAEDFGEQLGVKMFKKDFENEDVSELGQFDIITLIHCIEHFYDPLKSLRKIRSLLNPGGLLFVRAPDSQVPGIERDFTPGHFDIHPFIWTEESMYEVLAQLGNCFQVYETYPLNNIGQRDFALRAIDKKPTICAGYITKNEERDLPKSLKSIKELVDGVCIRDTGSTDGTERVAKESDLNIDFQTYTEASKKDENGDWKLWNFSQARNEYVDWIDSKFDWLLWMDADDEVTPEAIKTMRRVIYAPPAIHGFVVAAGNSGHVHHRLWPTKNGIKFFGAVHEYPRWPTNFKIKEHGEKILHDGTDGIGETSILRNLRILEQEVADGHKTHRNLFYLANTHRDAFGATANKEHLAKAIAAYDLYLQTPNPTYHDEMMHCYFYKARCGRLLGDRNLVLKTVRDGIAKDASFAELYMEACYTEFNFKNYWAAIGWAAQAKDLPYTLRLFSEKNKYTDQPLRMMTHCFKNLGLIDAAKAVGNEINRYTQDASWKAFLNELDSKVININRPGAIGDVILVSWFLSGLKKKYNAKIVLYTKCKEIADLLEDVDSVMDSDDWAKRASGIDFCPIGYPVKDGYPEKPMTRHLLDYLEEEFGVARSTPKIKTLESVEAEYVTVHVSSGWSPYKNWPISYWEELLEKLHQEYPSIQFIQIGSNKDPVLNAKPYIDNLVGKTSMAETATLIKNAKLHLGIDSFSNHMADVFKTPAVILFGSTSPVGSGYESARNLWLGLACSPCYKEDPKVSLQPRGVCENPPGQTYENPKPACMTGLTVERVLAEIKNYILL